MNTKLNAIYETFRPGSRGFVNAVSAQCGYEISDEEIARIGRSASTPDQFQKIWEDEDWWTDKNNVAE